MQHNAAAFETPLSWMLLVSLLVLALVWRLYDLFVSAAASCVQAIGLMAGGPTGGVSPMAMFVLAFVSAAVLWFFNLIRYRTVRQSYTRRFFEALLIGLGLLTSLSWSELVKPLAPEGRITAFVREDILERTPYFMPQYVSIELAPFPIVLDLYPEPVVNAQGQVFEDTYEIAPGVDDADFPLGIFKRPASQCACLSAWDEHVRYQRAEVEFLLAHAQFPTTEPVGLEHLLVHFAHKERPELVRRDEWIDPRAHAQMRLDRLPAEPEMPQWCDAVRDLARTAD